MTVDQGIYRRSGVVGSHRLAGLVVTAGRDLEDGPADGAGRDQDDRGTQAKGQTFGAHTHA
jgi:hypothetical protein